MFYAHFVLSKKGPLARIWLAAHWDKKLTKAHIFETSIEGSVEAIMQPQVKLALRTSGHLLLGVVRIYSRKAKYLLEDCNAAIVKIKMAFRPGAVDLPEDRREAAVAAVTMPETFHDFDSFLTAPVEFDIHSQYAVHQSQPEEITLREDNRAVSFFVTDDFGDFEAEGIVLPEDRPDLGLYARSERVAEYFEPRSNEPQPRSISPQQPSEQSSDDVGESAGMEVDAEMQPVTEQQVAEAESEKAAVDDNANDITAASADVYNYEAPGADETMETEFGGQMDAEFFGDMGGGGELFEEPKTPAPVTTSQHSSVHDEQDVADQSSVRDQTTIINNDATAFALGPIDATTVGTERKAKKKRKLIIDAQKLIPSETMRGQLRRSADLLMQLELAPPTKKLMEWKDLGGVDKLLVMPGKQLTTSSLAKLFGRGLVTRHMTDEEEMRVKRRRRQVDAEVSIPLEQPANEPPVAAERPVAVSPAGSVQEARRGASTSGADLSVNISRMSDAVEAGIEPSVSSDISRVSLPSVNDSLAVGNISISIPDIGRLPAVGDVPDVAIDDVPVVAVDDLVNIQSPVSVRPVVPSPRSAYADVSSVGPVLDEADETAFNETLKSGAADLTLMAEGEDQDDVRVLNRRSGQLLHAIHRAFETQSTDVIFRDLVGRNNRKQVAAKFHTLLVLKKLQAVDVKQRAFYGDIRIARGPTFDTIVLE